MLKNYQLYNSSLDSLSDRSLLITTLNAHSYNVTHHDKEFEIALQQSDVLLPDGISVVLAAKLLRHPQATTGNLNKIAGEDLFYYEMNRVETQYIASSDKKGRVLFLGSTEEVLSKIKKRAGEEFPHVEVYTYSPPYKPEFSEEDNLAMLKVIQQVQPDVLFIGMTAPKQEKWAYKLLGPPPLKGSEKYTENGFNSPLGVRGSIHICCIGAVFDFYAGTVQRAPKWIIRIGLEWLYRLLKEPRRMWRRYLIGNVTFILHILRELILKK